MPQVRGVLCRYPGITARPFTAPSRTRRSDPAFSNSAPPLAGRLLNADSSQLPRIFHPMTAPIDRRQFMQGAGTLTLATAFAPNQNVTQKSMTTTLPWPQLKGSPVLDSLHPVIENSRDVYTHPRPHSRSRRLDGLRRPPMPDYALPLGVGAGSPDDTIDFIMTADSVDTAFSDFTTHEKFQVDYAGRHWSDSDALFACMKRAMDNGIPILDGSFLATVTRPQLEKIFAGNIEMPMLDEKMAVWHQVGAVLAEKYQGRFHNFIRSCPPRLYDNGNGLVERLAKEFPRFNDVSPYDGHTIKFYKLPQLGLWFCYSTLRNTKQFPIEDLTSMTAFADYMVPVALRLLGIMSYSPALENAINTHQLIARDSTQEVELRAHCIYASAPSAKK